MNVNWRFWRNMRGLRYLPLAVYLVLGCLVVGCRSVKVIYRGPEIGAAGFVGGLAVGGVTPTEAARGYIEQDRLGQMVCGQLQARWPAGPATLFKTQRNRW